MLSQAPHGGEAAAAGGAAERFLSRVNQLVSLQVVGLTEALPADAALERLLAAVDAFVSDEVLRHAEALPAHLADVRFLSRVRAPVQVETRLRGERFLTLSAAEGIPLRVAASVRLQVVQ